MSESYQAIMDAAIRDLLTAFDVNTPPVPVEIMLQRPKAGMWQQVNLSELSAAFVNVRERYSPRMSIARLLVRYICRSEWGLARNLAQFQNDEPAVRTFARTLLMPHPLIESIPETSRTLTGLSFRFEVPEDEARIRLIELGYSVKT